MIATSPFGITGHISSRTIFGAAAFMSIPQEETNKVLELLLEFGVNHIDVAASYGDAELRLGPWMKEHRKKFFLASKTGDRTADEARRSIERSLERMQIDQLDLIQLHNLVNNEEWETAMSADGALKALIKAKEEGLVRFIGVTGHGTVAPKMHLQSLDRFEFDSVLFPFNYLLMQDDEYREDVRKLVKICQDRGIALQTIKSIARRRFREDDPQRRYSWYEPIKEVRTIRSAVHWVLSKPDLFLLTSSDLRMLKPTLEAAREYETSISVEGLESKLKTDAKNLEMEPLFIRGIAEDL